jgi:hypothetical protein
MNIPVENQEKSLLIYKGAFTVNLISILGNQIRLLPEIDFRIVQKIFRIFMELTQNVSYYSAEVVNVKSGVSCGSGWVSVQDFPDCMKVTTGNRILPEHAPKLIKYCTEINTYNNEELRKLKRDIRSQALERDTGAQIGLIQTSIISATKLDIQITTELEKDDFFIISACTSKEASDNVIED